MRYSLIVILSALMCASSVGCNYYTPVSRADSFARKQDTLPVPKLDTLARPDTPAKAEVRQDNWRYHYPAIYTFDTSEEEYSAEAEDSLTESATPEEFSEN